VALEPLREASREDEQTVLSAFASTDPPPEARQFQVGHLQPGGLRDPEPRPVEQFEQEPRFPASRGPDEPGGLLRREDAGSFFGFFSRS
jgi:hypothetical protein